MPRGSASQILAYLIILCFERRCPKQNTVARLKSKILPLTNFLAPPKIWADYATVLDSPQNVPSLLI